jgi:hypothetical protein
MLITLWLPMQSWISTGIAGYINYLSYIGLGHTSIQSQNVQTKNITNANFHAYGSIQILG